MDGNGWAGRCVHAGGFGRLWSLDHERGAIIASVYFLAWLLARLGATGIHAAGIGFLAAFTIHHLHTMNSNMFAGEPYGLAWITGGYVVVSLTIAGFILGSWVKKSG